MLGERGASAGSGSGHYFHQDLYVGRAIAAAQPKVHVDVGGRVDGFVAHVATFRSLYYVDLRPFPEPVSGVTDVQADITSEASVRALVDRGVLPPADSLSFLHTIEHIGLGRYGDTIDPAGHVKALTNLMRLLRPGGTLYLSTPIGPGRVEFNAHRVFHPADIEELLDTTGLTVMRRALVDDTGRMVGEVGETGLADAVEAGLVHGLGIWTAVRRDDPGPLSPAAG
jgi:SAM-dependent methyltransferase